MIAGEFFPHLLKDFAVIRRYQVVQEKPDELLIRLALTGPMPEAARARNLFQLDATCPLVTKVHREADVHFRKGREIILVGHAGHPEVVGTIGQLPPGAV